MRGFDFQSLFTENPERQLVSGPGATSEYSPLLTNPICIPDIIYRK